MGKEASRFVEEICSFGRSGFLRKPWDTISHNNTVGARGYGAGLGTTDASREAEAWLHSSVRLLRSVSPDRVNSANPGRIPPREIKGRRARRVRTRRWQTKHPNFALTDNYSHSRRGHGFTKNNCRQRRIFLDFALRKKAKRSSL
jgi:hypothetical protein